MFLYKYKMDNLYNLRKFVIQLNLKRENTMNFNLPISWKPWQSSWFLRDEKNVSWDSPSHLCQTMKSLQENHGMGTETISAPHSFHIKGNMSYFSGRLFNFAWMRKSAFFFFKVCLLLCVLINTVQSAKRSDSCFCLLSC